jgi:aminoglycoside 6-adenylyltransferase
MDNAIISKLVGFAEADDAIRAVILEGSLAAGRFIDDLSDYDVNIFTRNARPYLNDDLWMGQFGNVLIYQKEEFDFYDQIITTRLVIFADGLRIDFSFWPLGYLTEMADGSKPYEPYRNGFQVLVDKDGLAASLPAPDKLGFHVHLPEKDLFLQTVYDFWFEAYSIAKALVRGDLWYAKRMDASYVKDHLYQMVLWEHQRRLSWSHDPVLHLGGKRFEKWASPQLLEAISTCFSAYNEDETWASLFAMLGLFNRIAQKLAGELKFKYPLRAEKEIVTALNGLWQRAVRDNDSAT